ncbi:nuclease-related domain-containing protein [Accumulibacter sp.]|uniref:nuclease-related domain-containing protein n=1 Tax=Accumulibacter sp. TaxID=2053492 RepID=UPI0035B4084C
MKANTRSPLKDKPLRLPGQSLEEERRKLFEDKLEMPGLAAILAVLLTSMEWWRYYAERPPQPVAFSVFAFGFVAFAAWRFWRLVPKLRALRQGVEGERAVGQFLERLRESGYHVFHDVMGDGFNIDHVAIGPAGIFTIETKTWSKPLKGDARVICEGDSLRVGSLEPDRNPLIQAKAQAAWLKQLLSASTGKAYGARAVLLFPGWYVEQGPGTTREVWVLEPKALPAFLAKESTVLKKEDIALASYHLSRFIREEERRRAAL